jgi:hypothetical protein
MIFKRLEYVDNSEGKLVGLSGFIDDQSVAMVFVTGAPLAYSWSIMINDTIIRDVDTYYDGTMLSLYFEPSVKITEFDKMIIQLSLIPDTPDSLDSFLDHTIRVIQEIVTKTTGDYVLSLEEPDDQYFRDMVYRLF